MKRTILFTFPLFFGLISAFGYFNLTNPSGLFFKNWEGKKAPLIKGQSIYGDSVIAQYPCEHYTLIIMTEIG